MRDMYEIRPQIAKRSPRPIKFGISRENRNAPTISDKPWRNGMRKSISFNAMLLSVPVLQGREHRNEDRDPESHASYRKNLFTKIIAMDRSYQGHSKIFFTSEDTHSFETLMSKILEIARNEKECGSDRSRTLLRTVLNAFQRALDKPSRNRNLQLQRSHNQVFRHKLTKLLTHLALLLPRIIFVHS